MKNFVPLTTFRGALGTLAASTRSRTLFGEGSFEGKRANRQWSLFIALVVLSASSFPTTGLAQSLYGAVAGGYSFQASDSNPYGENIAADSDFPSAFGSGAGAAGTIAIGYVVSESARFEGRVGLHRGSFTETQFGIGERNGAEYILDGDINSTTFTIEGFFDVPLGPVTPYLKAGVGASSNNYAARLGGAGVAAFDPFDGTADGYYDAYSDETSTGFAWNVGVGVSTALSNRFDLFAEYQFITFGDAATGQDDFTDGFRLDGASAHEAFVGLRVRLGSKTL